MDRGHDEDEQLTDGAGHAVADRMPLSGGAGPPVADRTPLSPDAPHRTLGAIRSLVDGGLVAWIMRALGRPSSREDASLPGIAWAAIVLAIVGLGTWGFLALHHSPRLNGAESVYDAAKLYTIDLGPASSQPGPNWQIWVAFVAAALLVLRGVGALVRGHARRFATSRMLKRHVIVCGAGVHGSELARSLSGQHDVVVIDTDPVSPGLQGVHGRYEWRLIGDAVSPRTLHQAGISRAHRVVAVTGDDVVNSEIVSTVRRPRAGRAGAGPCRRPGAGGGSVAGAISGGGDRARRSRQRPPSARARSSTRSAPTRSPPSSCWSERRSATSGASRSRCSSGSPRTAPPACCWPATIR